MTDIINELRQELATANERLTQTVSDFRNLAETLRLTTVELESEREAVAALGRSFDAMRTERDAEREARKALEAYVRNSTPDSQEATRMRDAALALVRELPRSISLTPPEWEVLQ